MTGPDCRDCIYHIEDEDRKICTKRSKNRWNGGDGCKFFSDHYEKKEGTNEERCEAIRTRQAELWKNATYKRVFGGSKK